MPDGKGGIESGTGLDMVCCALWDVKGGDGPQLVPLPKALC